MASHVESLRLKTSDIFSRINTLRGRAGEILFGTTGGESVRMMAFYGLVMSIGAYGLNPVVLGAGFAGLAGSWKEYAIKEAKAQKQLSV